jgi:hypothetical protein
MENKRFQKVYSEGNGFVGTSQILVDTETGVHYLFHAYGYAGGLTVLLDANGKPVTSPTGYKNNFPSYE